MSELTLLPEVPYVNRSSEFWASMPLKVRQPTYKRKVREFDFAAAARQVAAKVAPPQLTPDCIGLVLEWAITLKHLPSETARQINHRFRDQFIDAPRSCGGKFYPTLHPKSGVHFYNRRWIGYADSFLGKRLCCDCAVREEQRWEQELSKIGANHGAALIFKVCHFCRDTIVEQDDEEDYVEYQGGDGEWLSQCFACWKAGAKCQCH